MPHKTGSPTKRKLETDLQQETRKCQKLESTLSQVQEELDSQKIKNTELERVNNRPKNLRKGEKRERGRSRGKKNVSKVTKKRA